MDARRWVLLVEDGQLVGFEGDRSVGDRGIKRLGVGSVEEIRRLEAALDRAQAKVRELHRALSEGHGVEDGGAWEDRALAAEADLDRYRELLERLVRADDLANTGPEFERAVYEVIDAARSLLALEGGETG